jgi:hypothetical protein
LSTTVLVPVTGCPVCALPYRGELEALLASGMSFARVALQLADREPPVPAREELAAHVTSGHLLPAAERGQLLAPRPLPPRDPVGALELSIAALSARIAAGDLSHISTMPALASTLARLQEPAHAGQAAEMSNAFMVATETALAMCMALAPVLGLEGARRLREAYRAAVRAALEEYKAAGSCVTRTPQVEFADADGRPWTRWDRARVEALREEIADDLIFERLLARWRTDPGRFYPPWPSDQLAPVTAGPAPDGSPVLGHS